MRVASRRCGVRGVDIVRWRRTVSRTMTAWRRSLAVGGLVLGSVGLAVPVLAVASGTSRRTSATNRQAAVQDAFELLRRVNLPAEVRRSAGEPAGSRGQLTGLPMSLATPLLVYRTGWWTTKESLKQVMRYVVAHPPDGGRLFVSG
jgi:hypothetical protein